MNRLKNVFKYQPELNSTEAMIISACHSQKIGEKMLEAGVPVVICINAPFKIQDEAARCFGVSFLSALIQGYSYNDAFKYGRH